MDPTLWRAFVDELEKISEVRVSPAVEGMKASVRKMRETLVRKLPEKNATLIKYTKPKMVIGRHHIPEVTKMASRLGRKTNALFGLPIDGSRKGVRRYENGPSAAQSADRTQLPIAGQSTPAISSTSNTMNPAVGPGGV
jgi:hypothetical protein